MIRETAAISATLCALVPALLPLAERGLAATHDGLIHVQRLIAMEAALRQGAPFTRWLPDLAYGYGQPLLLYYAPLAYLPALTARLLGAGYVDSIELASGLALVLASLTMYLLARSLFSPLAACAAAAVYGLLPYQMVDLYVRGALAESWAFVWLPLAAWCLLGVWNDGRSRWSVGLALSVAGLVLTHNVTALLFLPALLVLLGLLWSLDRAEERSSPLRPLAAIGLGLALSAWFWLPALAERGLVQIGETLEPDLFASFFLRGWPPFRLEPLFDYERPVSTALGSPIFWPQLGLIQLVISVAGGVAAVRTVGVRRVLAIWAVLLVVVGYLMQFGPLAPLYDLVPLLAFVQFPWRLLALMGLGAAILAAVLVEAMSARSDIRSAFAVCIVVASLVTAVTRLQPEATPVDDRLLSTETIGRLELADYGLGTTHSGEYLPVSSGQRNAARFRKTLLDAGTGQSRLASAPPIALQIERIDWHPNRISVELTAPEADRLVLHQFAFPGWSTRVDGAPVAMATAGQVGAIAIDVPAGRHVVEAVWSWTPLRAVATAISLAAVLGLAALASARPWRPERWALVASVVAAGIMAVVLVPEWSGLTPHETGSPISGPSAAGGGTVSVVDVRHDLSRLSTDRLLQVKLTLLVRQTPTTGYRAHVEVQAPDGSVHRAPWIYEPQSRLWERGEVVPATVDVRLPPEFPSGESALQLVFDRPEGIPPVALGNVAIPRFRPETAAGAAGPGVDIGQDLQLKIDQNASGGPGVPSRVRAGYPLDVPLRWSQTGALPNVDHELYAVAVLQVPGGELLSAAGRPGDWFAPMPFWQAGDAIGQRLRIAVPPGMRPGGYPLSVRVYSRDLARGGLSEPGASSARPRGRPIAELSVGIVTVTP